MDRPSPARAPNRKSNHPSIPSNPSLAHLPSTKNPAQGSPSIPTDCPGVLSASRPALLRHTHSNSPFQIYFPLISRLLSCRPLFRVTILTFQREFALRLVATPESSLCSQLSANVQSERLPPQVEISLTSRDKQLDFLTKFLILSRNRAKSHMIAVHAFCSVCFLVISRSTCRNHQSRT